MFLPEAVLTRRRLRWPGLVLACALLATAPRLATAISSPSCQFVGGQLNIGTYSPLMATDSTQSLGFSCAVNFAWNEPLLVATFRLCLFMGEDPGSKAGYQPWRYLKNNNVTGTGEAYLAYNLYADPGHAQILMPASTGVPLVVDFTLSGTRGRTYISGTGSIPVYARIPGGQLALPASPYYSYNPPFTLRYQAVSGSTPPDSCEGGGATHAVGAIQIASQVTESCSLSTRGVNFGTIAFPGVTSLARAAEGGITVQCSTGKPYTVYLGNGNNPASQGYRQMANGDARLTYQLYQDSAHTRVWNDTGGTVQAGGVGGVSGTGNGSAQSLTVYGQIPAGTNVPGAVGTYTDTVMVTVAY